MEDEIKQNLRNRDTWWRALYILLFMVIYGVAEFVIGAVVLFQLYSVLFTGYTNERLLTLGQNLTRTFTRLRSFLPLTATSTPIRSEIGQTVRPPNSTMSLSEQTVHTSGGC